MTESRDDLDRELAAALLPLRPDPEAFLASVEAKAAKLQVDPSSSGPEARESLAASIVPWTLLPAAGKATTALPSFGTKLLTVLSWPALSIFVLLGAALGSARDARRAKRTYPDQSATPTRDTLRQLWYAHRYLNMAFCVLALLTLMVGSTFYVIVTLGFSTIALTFLIRRASRAGLGQRPLIAGFCSLGLFNLGMPLTFSMTTLAAEPHAIDPLVLPIVFLAGAAGLLFTFGLEEVASSPLLEGVRWRFPTILIGTTVLLGWGVIDHRCSHPTAIRETVESFARARFGSVSWKEWELLARSASRKGDRLDLHRPAALLERTLRSDDDPDPYLLGAAIRGGLAETVFGSMSIDWDSVDRRRERWLEGLERYSIPSWEQRYWMFVVALERGPWSSGQKELLRSRLLENLELVPSPADAELLVDGLDRLGNVQDLRELVHRSLARHWIPIGERPRSEGGFGNRPNATHADFDETLRAVRLIDRFGTPESIDLRQLYWYLQRRASVPLPFTRNVQHLLAEAARDELAPHVPPVTIGEFLFLERSLIGALILVALCFHATWCASETPSLRGGDLGGRRNAER
ncbi:MAG: hypothetical protein KDC38_06745 [Planctomycetes bacterium]|nr:hypothetical protein [Planctomycetota bacterium]